MKKWKHMFNLCKPFVYTEREATDYVRAERSLTGQCAGDNGNSLLSRGPGIWWPADWRIISVQLAWWASLKIGRRRVVASGSVSDRVDCVATSGCPLPLRLPIDLGLLPTHRVGSGTENSNFHDCCEMTAFTVVLSRQVLFYLFFRPFFNFTNNIFVRFALDSTFAADIGKRELFYV